jgi:hypothetical protein
MDDRLAASAIGKAPHLSWTATDLLLVALHGLELLRVFQRCFSSCMYTGIFPGFLMSEGPSPRFLDHVDTRLW